MLRGRSFRNILVVAAFADLGTRREVDHRIHVRKMSQRHGVGFGVYEPAAMASGERPIDEVVAQEAQCARDGEDHDSSSTWRTKPGFQKECA